MVAGRGSRGPGHIVAVAVAVGINVILVVFHPVGIKVSRDPVGIGASRSPELVVDVTVAIAVVIVALVVVSVGPRNLVAVAGSVVMLVVV